MASHHLVTTAPAIGCITRRLKATKIVLNQRLGKVREKRGKPGKRLTAALRRQRSQVRILSSAPSFMFSKGSTRGLPRSRCGSRWSARVTVFDRQSVSRQFGMRDASRTSPGCAPEVDDQSRQRAPATGLVESRDRVEAHCSMRSTERSAMTELLVPAPFSRTNRTLWTNRTFFTMCGGRRESDRGDAIAGRRGETAGGARGERRAYPP